MNNEEALNRVFDTPADPRHAGQVRHMLASFRRFLGYDLFVCPPQGDAALTNALAGAPFILVSHGTEADPILNYGNHAALKLWEMDWKTFTRTPSRLTAEPVDREERVRLLERVLSHGYIDGYQGIRISSSGRRFRMEQAVVWNVRDECDRPVGQAATFARWVGI